MPRRPYGWLDSTSKHGEVQPVIHNSYVGAQIIPRKACRTRVAKHHRGFSHYRLIRALLEYESRPAGLVLPGSRTSRSVKWKEGREGRSLTFAKGAALLGDRFGGRSMDNDRTVTVNSEAPATRRRFLVIGDDKKVGQALQTVFDEPYDVVRAANAEEALRALAGRGADVVL